MQGPVVHERLGGEATLRMLRADAVLRRVLPEASP